MTLMLADGARTAIEAFAETLCFAASHPHTSHSPACPASRRRADSYLLLLSLNRKRAEAVGQWLLDGVVKGITADIERSVIA